MGLGLVAPVGPARLAGPAATGRQSKEAGGKQVGQARPLARPRQDSVKEVSSSSKRRRKSEACGR
eukprot:6058659-Heterocapsa_arctica.AAC.1